jgi:hypothetical protein
LERRDRLLAAALERIPPQLEAPQEPSEPRGAPEAAAESRSDTVRRTPRTATAPVVAQDIWVVKVGS